MLKLRKSNRFGSIIDPIIKTLIRIRYHSTVLICAAVYIHFKIAKLHDKQRKCRIGRDDDQTQSLQSPFIGHIYSID